MGDAMALTKGDEAVSSRKSARFAEEQMPLRQSEQTSFTSGSSSMTLPLLSITAAPRTPSAWTYQPLL